MVSKATPRHERRVFWLALAGGFRATLARTLGRSRFEVIRCRRSRRLGALAYGFIRLRRSERRRPPAFGVVSLVPLSAMAGLVAACDLAIAASDAQFGMPEVNVGVFPMMIMAIVFRNVPRKAGMELMLTGKRIDAAEAARIGLINRHVPPAQLDAEVETLANELAKKSPIGMRLGLEAFYRMQDMSFPSAIAYLQDQLALLGLSDDLKEGVTAFFEKREPRFTGK